MAISGFGRGKSSDGEAPTGSAAQAAPSTNLTAFIDQGSHFEGKLSFKDTVRIDGSFQGEISSENTLIVGESGEVEAAITSTNVIVSGRVVGNIEARRQVVLHKTASVQSDIVTPSLIVEEGAEFNGRISMKRGKSDTAAKPVAVAALPSPGTSGRSEKADSK